MSDRPNKPEWSLIVAMDRNRVIGKDGDLPWHLPEDLKHFKRVTMDKPILMGRRTHQSIGRPLPGRRNLVLSRSGEGIAPGCEWVRDMDSARSAVSSEAEVVVIGGASVYAEALPACTRLYLTQVDACLEGDTVFPVWDASQWTKIRTESFARDDRHPYAFVCSEWIRKRENLIHD